MTSPRAARPNGSTRRFNVGGAQGYLITSTNRDGTLRDVLVHLGKHGSTLRGMSDALYKLINRGLEHGVPLGEIVGDLVGVAYEPKGMTNDPEIRQAASITDYIGRRLALDFLPYSEQVALGVLTPQGQTTRKPSNGAGPTEPKPRTSALVTV